jgi:hypothetical protein
MVWMLERARDPAETMAVRRAATSRASRAGARASDLAALYDGVIEYELRALIIDELATDGSKPALDKLLSVAQQTSGDARVRKHAITKLSETGDPRAKSLLQSIVDK